MIFWQMLLGLFAWDSFESPRVCRTIKNRNLLQKAEKLKIKIHRTQKINLQVAVDISDEWADVGDGSGEPPVVLEVDDCVDVSNDSLHVSVAISDIVIDIRRPPDRVLVS